MARFSSSSVAVIAIIFALLCTVSEARFLNLVSDAHYDPAYGTPDACGMCINNSFPVMGEPKCDAPLALITSAMNDISKQRSAYTIFSGDWARHHMSASGLSISTVFGPMSDFYQNLDIDSDLPAPYFVGCLGNNDVVPDYYFPYNATSHPNLTTEIDIMKNHGLLTAEEGVVMAKCGYYSRNASTTLRIIALHTIVWTNMIKPAVPDSVEDPCGQFAFLETELAVARGAGQKVIVFGHIPPLPNVFEVVSDGEIAEGDMYWKPFHQARYTALIHSNRDMITAQFFGHTHRFALVADPAFGVPLFILGAITQIYLNKPNYMIGEFDDNDWSLLSMHQRQMVTEINTWISGQEVTAALGLSTLKDTDKMHSELDQLLTNDVLWDNYQTIKTGGVIIQPCTNNFCRVMTVCAMQFSSFQGINDCLNAKINATTTTTTTPLS